MSLIKTDVHNYPQQASEVAGQWLIPETATPEADQIWATHD